MYSFSIRQFFRRHTGLENVPRTPGHCLASELFTFPYCLTGGFYTMSTLSLLERHAVGPIHHNPRPNPSPHAQSRIQCSMSCSFRTAKGNSSELCASMHPPRDGADGAGHQKHHLTPLIGTAMIGKYLIMKSSRGSDDLF